MNDLIAKTLTGEGWLQDAENPHCYYRLGKAVYVYPTLKRLKYWPDVRWHNYFYEYTLPITQHELRTLIARS